ncbi:MAG TPA: hypothetical protein VGC64_00790 [Pyrinomonadaceae bacterium]|jgi:hypothetical protein
MKQLAAAAALLVFIIYAPTHAQSRCRKETVAQLNKRLANAYQSKTLTSLDAEHPFAKKIKLVIEHSLDEDSYEIKYAPLFEYLEEWLKNREREDGTPFRAVMPRVSCRKNTCTYDFDGGIDHNHLYLQEVSYGYRKGCPYIRTIYLYDGD